MHADAFREHLREITESAAFKGSRRSQEFLNFIVSRALEGNSELLKERVLGVEIFGRPASYDTSEDAIVRVTASDVRRRLHQFYSDSAVDSQTRIELPSGSYVPDFRWEEKRPQAPLAVASVEQPPATGLTAVPEPPAVSPAARHSRTFLPLAVAAAVVCILGWGLFGGWWRPASAQDQPLGSLFRSGRELRVVYCDPDISLTQAILGFQINLSDYANRIYRPADRPVSAELQRALDAMRGTKVAFVDSTIALNLSKLAIAAGASVKTHTARSLQLGDFKTGENFVLLGSPRSNPWFELFADKLDFRFAIDERTNQEIIVDARPMPGESPRYLPTAQGGGTGQAYAILALLPNPGQTGHVLVLAGTNAEATEAAGLLATNVELLSRTLKANRIDTRGGAKPFEILLRVSTMAGSPNTFDVVACHALRP